MTTFAKGDYSYAICMRSGFKTLQKDMCVEPGTGLLISRFESDGQYNAVDHPQNKSPKNRLENKPQRFALSGKYETIVNYLLDTDGYPMLDESGNPLIFDPS